MTRGRRRSRSTPGGTGLQLAALSLALAIYEAVLERAPGSRRPAVRAYWLHALYRDPVRPDSGAYRAQMARLDAR